MLASNCAVDAAGSEAAARSDSSSCRCLTVSTPGSSVALVGCLQEQQGMLTHAHDTRLPDSARLEEQHAMEGLHNSRMGSRAMQQLDLRIDDPWWLLLSLAKNTRCRAPSQEGVVSFWIMPVVLTPEMQPLARNQALCATSYQRLARGPAHTLQLAGIVFWTFVV